MKSSKPEFNKTAQFQGTDAEYTAAVLAQASTGVTGGDEFRLAAQAGLRSEDVQTGILYLNRPTFTAPQGYKWTEPYNEVVWFIAEKNLCSGHAVAPCLQAGVRQEDIGKAWDYLNPKAAAAPKPALV